MKKALIALAVLGLTGGAAVAQSSVTLFGVVDVAARYTKGNGNNVKLLSNDGSSSSRLGVRGVEDLGGGLKAGFWLESGLAADTGIAGDTGRGAFWNRRTSISLMGDFGEVRLGRGKTSNRLVIDDFDVYSTTGLGDVTRVLSTLGLGTAIGTGVDTNNRSDNLVQYFLPGNLSGFYGSVDVAAGEGVDGKKMYGGRLGYKIDAFNVAGGYQSTDVRGSKYKLGSVGASYDFGVAKLSALLVEAKFNNLKQDNITVGVTVPVTESSFLTAQYTSASTNGAADSLPSTAGDAKFYTLGYQYNLSKRTALYTTAAIIDNSGAARFTLPGVAATNPNSGGRVGSVDVGVKHSF